MSIRLISTEQLRRMEDQEGLVLQGCGGDPQEWLDGINEILAQECILKKGAGFEEAYTFRHDGLTCMLFPFKEDIELDVGKLAAWRLAFYSTFGGTWLSDYVPNRLDGFIQERRIRNVAQRAAKEHREKASHSRVVVHLRTACKSSKFFSPYLTQEDLSRFGRNYKETGNYLERIFPFLGVRFIAVNDGFDTLTAQRGADGDLVPLKNLINEVYSKDISKKSSSALVAKQKNGDFIGAWAPYGYRKCPDTPHKWNRMKQQLPSSGRYSGGEQRALASHRLQGGSTMEACLRPLPICTIPARAKQKSITA